MKPLGYIIFLFDSKQYKLPIVSLDYDPLTEVTIGICKDKNFHVNYKFEVVNPNLVDEPNAKEIIKNKK